MVEQESSEQVGKSPRWTDRETQILRNDGIIIMYLREDRISDQIKKREPLIVSNYSSIVPSSTRINQIGIYTTPRDFFVPDTHAATLEESEDLVRKDTEDLKRRLGIKNMAGIIPDNVADVTKLIFQHAKNTGVWLLGGNWASGNKYPDEYSSLVAVRTKNPMVGNDGSTGFAVVSFEALSGSIPPRLRISMFEDKYLRNCNMSVAVMRMFIPTGNNKSNSTS